MAEITVQYWIISSSVFQIFVGFFFFVGIFASRAVMQLGLSHPCFWSTSGLAQSNASGVWDFTHKLREPKQADCSAVINLVPVSGLMHGEGQGWTPSTKDTTMATLIRPQSGSVFWTRKLSDSQSPHRAISPRKPGVKSPWGGSVYSRKPIPFSFCVNPETASFNRKSCQVWILLQRV